MTLLAFLRTLRGPAPFLASAPSRRFGFGLDAVRGNPDLFGKPLDLPQKAAELRPLRILPGHRRLRFGYSAGISISVDRSPATRPRLELTWTRQGGPKINGQLTRGFGTELIERGIRFESQGEAKIETADGSLQCRMLIPADPQCLVFGYPAGQSEGEEAAS